MDDGTIFDRRLRLVTAMRMIFSLQRQAGRNLHAARSYGYGKVKNRVAVHAGGPAVGGDAFWNFKIELSLVLRAAAHSILAEETAARGFVARRVRPDADDIEATGSIR